MIPIIPPNPVPFFVLFTPNVLKPVNRGRSFYTRANIILKLLFVNIASEEKLLTGTRSQHSINENFS